jgi:hypothetical protein
MLNWNLLEKFRIIDKELLIVPAIQGLIEEIECNVSYKWAISQIFPVKFY